MHRIQIAPIHSKTYLIGVVVVNHASNNPQAIEPQDELVVDEIVTELN